MKCFSKFSFVLMLLMIGLSSFAQKDKALDDEELTESSDPFDNRTFLDDIVERKMLTESRVLPYEPIREADIAWQKRIWRIVDTREKMNQSFKYPERYFFSVMRELIENGDITGFVDERFKEEMTAEEIAGKISRIDTVNIFDEETYEEKIKIVQNEVNPEDIVRFRLKEIWFFDEESAKMDVRILGIAPVLDRFDEDTGEFKYEEVLFWIYYPEAREHFAAHKVFNDFNDMSPMNWASLFDTRFFASYIFKQSNSRDVRLKDLFPDRGIDLLLESEKIKAELFNFEHDLWEY